MLLTPHTMVGIAIASMVPNPIIAAPISFGMHFLGDMVPHWDFYTNTTREERIKGWRPLLVMADMAAGVGLGTLFTAYALWVEHNPTKALNIFLCGIASVLPDALTGPSLYVEKSPKIFKLIHSIQSKMQFPAKLPWGAVTQIIVLLVSLLVTLSLR